MMMKIGEKCIVTAGMTIDRIQRQNFRYNDTLYDISIMKIDASIKCDNLYLNLIDGSSRLGINYPVVLMRRLLTAIRDFGRAARNEMRINETMESILQLTHETEYQILEKLKTDKDAMEYVES
jgi:hypothetical protein